MCLTQPKNPHLPEHNDFNHKSRINEQVKLPEDMVFTTNLEAAVKGKDVLVLAVPSPYTRSTSHNMASYVKEGQIIVNVAKGIEETTKVIMPVPFPSFLPR